MRELGVTDHRFLGGAGRWRDSGMMGTASNERPDCFWQADLDEAIGECVRVMREVRPQVVVTYNEFGAYGHPDHINAHRVAVGAFDASGDAGRYPDAGEPWSPSKLYYTAFPKSVLRQGYEELKARGVEEPFGVSNIDDLEMGEPDEIVTTQIDARDYLEAKIAAMRAHASQIAVDGWLFKLSNNIGQRAFGNEYYRLVRGTSGAPDGQRETDLFAGVEPA
jgi:N-acetyl-1-D-myo-inositol-2-amino-2-deoxy-alpha-D-glucopyranoside deacetylase